ncbi:hypothetical protein [uncultured Clostridium sp.]|uniref:hypothetical protein n=1 Tax=uncultured Clostridium sp. TaxID=59620 RepID=UPI0028E3303A|nr:hypothetical protein [uncultured Clostridium sp.]
MKTGKEMATLKYKNDGLPNNVEPQTHYQEIYLNLKSKGFDVYAPEQKRDKCIKPYVVIKENGQFAMAGNVAGYNLVQIFCYYPKDQCSQLEFFVDNVKTALDKIDFLRPTGNRSPVLFFEEIQAYGQSMEYQIFHKFK